MSGRFRFAPTPSRPLHAGSALAALIGWATARNAGGAFLVRIEDIDRSRCRPEFETTALDDLEWLGVDWDEGPRVGGAFTPYRQSERMERYDAALEALDAQGRVYPCRCSRSDVRAAQRAPHLHADAVSGELPYPGTCRGVDGPMHPDRGGFRLAVDALKEHARVAWNDRWLGAQFEDVRTTCGDFLLGRPQAPTYQLAVVVDDIAMGITDVIRGADLAGSSARQALLHQALGATPPSFGHHPLIVDAAGRKLSKRDGDATLAARRAAGQRSTSLIAALGRIVGVFGHTVDSATADDFRAALVDATLTTGIATDAL